MFKPIVTVLVVLPLLALVGVQLLYLLWGYLRGKAARYLPLWLWWVALAVLLGYMVLRNLPFAPFCYLAPTYL